MQILSTRTDKPHRYRFSEIDNWVPFDPIEIAISADGENWTSIYDDPDLQKVLCADYTIPHATNTVTAQKFGVRHGQLVTSTSFSDRTITLSFFGHTKRQYMWKLMLNALEKYFAQVEQYWLVFGDQPYKKYHVTYTSMTPADVSYPYFQATVTLQDYDGIAVSTVTSSQARRFDVQSWGAGMGMPFGHDTTYSYTGDKVFSIFNPSDIDIDPVFQRHPLKITIHGVGGFTLRNVTNGSEITYGDVMQKGDTFQLYRTSPTLNGGRIGSKTDNGYIKISQGWNNFALTGLTDQDIAFDFPFYYLT